MFTHYFRFSRRGAVQRRRSPLLERLLARADAATPVTDWRAAAFRVIAAPAAVMPGVGPAALYSEFGELDAASVFIATPVHYLAEMSNVRLPTDGVLALRQPEAEALAADFTRVWNDEGIGLRAGRHGGLFCLTDPALPAATRDPEDVLDQHIENYLPSGAGAPRLRRLMSEIEMWLFEHPVNRSRLAAALPVVNGLWLWGGGSALTSLPEVHGWTLGDDPLFGAFAPRHDTPRRDAPGSAESGVAVTAAEPGTAEWSDIEAVLASSVKDLSARRIARLDLSAGDRCFSINARRSLRFWRRSRPWWETFG